MTLPVGVVEALRRSRGYLDTSLAYARFNEDADAVSETEADLARIDAALARYEGSLGSRPAAPSAPTEQGDGAVVGHTPQCWGRTSYSDEAAHCYCPTTDLADELRNALNHLLRVQGWEDETDEDEQSNWKVYQRTIESIEGAVEALTLARQQAAGVANDADTLAVLLDNVVIAQSLSRELRERAHDEARSYLYNRRQQAAVSPDTQAGIANGDEPKTYEPTGLTEADLRRARASAPAGDTVTVPRERRRPTCQACGRPPHGVMACEDAEAWYARAAGKVGE